MYKKAMGRVKSANENTLVKKGKSPVQIQKEFGIQGSQVPISQMSNTTKINNKSGAMKVMNQPFILEGQIQH